MLPRAHHELRDRVLQIGELARDAREMIGLARRLRLRGLRTGRGRDRRLRDRDARRCGAGGERQRAHEQEDPSDRHGVTLGATLTARTGQPSDIARTSSVRATSRPSGMSTIQVHGTVASSAG